MNEEISPVKVPQPGRMISRPVLLSLLCLFSFIFFGILSILFIVTVFFSGWITEVMNHYIPDITITKSRISLVLIAGALLHSAGFAGAVMIWKLKKKGYYLLGGSCLIVAASQTFLPQISAVTTAVYILLVLFFGLFFRRLS